MHWLRFSSLVLLGAFASAQSAPTSQPSQAAPAQQQQTQAAPPQQAAHPQQAPAEQKPSAPPEPTTAATATVITLEGVCDPKTAKAGQPCRTQITREEFERLFRAPGQPLPPEQQRQNIARQYTDLLMAASEGEKLGGENDPRVKEQLEVHRLQTLAAFAQQKLAEKARDVSDADAQQYYSQHPEDFEEVTLDRVFVPKTAAAGKDVDLKQLADQVQQQLANGGDPEKLQKAVYENLKTTSEPPSTKYGSKRRGSLPPQHDIVFTLSQGQVSPVLADPIGYVIYKVEAKRVVPFEEAKGEAKQRMAMQRFKEETERIRNGVKVDYNPQYFGSMPFEKQAAAPTLNKPAANPATSAPQRAASKPATSATPKK